MPSEMLAAETLTPAYREQIQLFGRAEQKMDGVVRA